MAGERVGVLGVVGDVAGRQLADAARVGLDRERSLGQVDRPDRPAHPVVDVVVAVVSPHDHPVADRELTLADLDRLAEPPVARSASRAAAFKRSRVALSRAIITAWP